MTFEFREVPALPMVVYAGNDPDMTEDAPRINPGPQNPDHDYAMQIERPVDDPNLKPGVTTVLDNLDYKRKVRNMTGEYQDQDVHYVNVSVVAQKILW